MNILQFSQIAKLSNIISTVSNRDNKSEIVDAPTRKILNKRSHLVELP